MEMERREEGGGEEEEEIREPIIYHSQTTRRKKVQHVYIYPHHTCTCTEIQIYQRYPPSYLLPPRYHTNPSFQHTYHNTLLQHLHLVLSITMIPYNNTDQYIPGTYLSKFHKHEQAPRRQASYSLPYLYLSDNKIQKYLSTTYIHIHK